MMNKKIYILLISVFLMLAACTDSMDIDKIGSESKLVMYCFPSGNDTTFIQLSRSTPVNNKTYGSSIAVDDATITYKVNDIQYPVHIYSKSKIYSSSDITPSVYYVLKKHAAGDRVEVDASTPDGLKVSSSTVVPAMPVMEKVDTFSQRQGWNKYLRLKLTFTDDATTDDYYAVRVLSRYVQYVDNGYETSLDTINFISSVDTDEEPLLNKLSDVDTDFGFSEDFYRNFYIFDDKQISGRTYTMNLSLSLSYYSSTSSISYKLQFFRLTPDFYRFLRTVNNSNGNDLAEYGFSPVTPIFTNVKGGFGVAGGYNMEETPWYFYEKK